MTLPQLPDPPLLEPMCRIECDVGDVVTLGRGPHGERRYVPLLGGRVAGPGFNGSVVPGGVDWQVLRDDGALDIEAHYVLRADDGGLVEVRSVGLRHGPPDVMARLARGDAVAPGEYFFRTALRFTTGAEQWLHLNKAMAIAVAAREARRVILDVYRIA
jgi:uncharacterized protein DUF3237